MVIYNPASLEIFDLHIVASFLLVPLCINNLVLGLDIFVESKLQCKVVKVCVYLFGTGVDSRPVKLRKERPRIVVRRYITCASASAN